MKNATVSPSLEKVGMASLPLSEIINDHNDVTMPPSRRWVACHKINAPLSKWANGDDWKKRSRMHVHFSRKNMAGVTLLDHFYAVFKD
jgi:hypothetical protein